MHLFLYSNTHTITVPTPNNPTITPSSLPAPLPSSSPSFFVSLDLVVSSTGTRQSTWLSKSTVREPSPPQNTVNATFTLLTILIVSFAYIVPVLFQLVTSVRSLDLGSVG